MDLHPTAAGKDRTPARGNRRRAKKDQAKGVLPSDGAMSNRSRDAQRRTEESGRDRKATHDSEGEPQPCGARNGDEDAHGSDDIQHQVLAGSRAHPTPDRVGLKVSCAHDRRHPAPWLRQPWVRHDSREWGPSRATATVIPRAPGPEVAWRTSHAMRIPATRGS